MRKALLSLASLLIALTINADDIVIKSPGYFTEPIRDGHQLFPDSLVLSTDAEEIEIPSMGMFGRLDRKSVV